MSTLAIDPGGAIPVLRDSEFEKIRALAYEHFGLDLRGGKQGLVAARLGKKLRELGLKSFGEYFDLVVSDQSGVQLATMVDYLTTNHTNFFREPRHFDFLCSTILPTLRSRSQIHIWSAACSSGEEPFSIAMSLLEEQPNLEGRVKIRATDISTRVLQKGSLGVYGADRCMGITEALMRKYMLQGKNGAVGSYRFKPELRAMIQFERLNLMETLPPGYRCSVIFCRNIMIYFDKPTQQGLVQRLSAQLEDGGYLFIGHSESLNSITHGLEYVSPATYRKPGGLSPGQTGRA